MPNENSPEPTPETTEPKETLETTPEVTTESTSADAPVVETAAPKSEPVVEPIVAPAQTEQPKPTNSSAGVLVLQWLTYAFWGWLILALVWLIGVVLANALLDESVTEILPYSIAASLVLLPLAFVTDFFYRKHEPLKKAGGAVIIMVIHAVIFALFGIGALIVTVFTGLNLAIEAGSVDGRLVALYTAGFATILYAATFLRTLNPFKSRKPLFIYSIFMLSATALLLIFAVVGPLAKSFATRNDRLIEQHLSDVEAEISDYIHDNNAVPQSLGDVDFDKSEGEQLVKNGLVEYKPEKPVAVSSNTTEYRYQLCVEYTSEKGSRYGSSYRSPSEYSSYASTSNHDAGKVCYKLQTTIYDYNSDAPSSKDDF